jgi:hypothetical protein
MRVGSMGASIDPMMDGMVELGPMSKMDPVGG